VKDDMDQRPLRGVWSECVQIRESTSEQRKTLKDELKWRASGCSLDLILMARRSFTDRPVRPSIFEPGNFQ
jgi:hypothetical protein